MSLQAIVIRFYLRHWFKRRLDPRAPVSALRANVAHLARRMPAAPKAVIITPAEVGGVKGEWVAAPGADARRVILYLHGGGYVSGTAASIRDLTWRLSAAARCQVLALDYRLAPEHPFPAAIEDVAAAYRALLHEDFAPASIAFAGDSAGGGLVYGSLVKLRDDGAPMPAAACSFSAVTDLALTGGTLKTNNEVDPMILVEGLPPVVAWYLGSTPATTPYASPLYADLRGLPPALLQVGSTEVLLDDSRRMAERLRAAGVSADLRIWQDMPHVWQGCGSFLPEARAAIAEAGQFLDSHVRDVERPTKAA